MNRQVKLTAVTFDAAPPVADDDEWVIYPDKKIFEVGDYPDLDFAMSADELAAAVADFQPVPVDLDHKPDGVLHEAVAQGRLGKVRGIRLADDGKSLLGTVALPKWLDTLLGDSPRKVSTMWDRATKRLHGLALVRSPRVSDAALMAAFSAATTPDASPDSLQHLLDAAAHSSASVTFDGPTLVAAVTAYVNMAGSRHSASDLADIQTIHDLTAKQGAACSPDNMPADMPMKMPAVSGKMTMSKENKGMNKSRFEKMLAWLNGEGNEAAFTGETAPPETPPAAAPPPATVPTVVNNYVGHPIHEPTTTAFSVENPRVAQRLAELEAENTRLREQGIQNEAVAFAEAEIGAGRAYPVERDVLIYAYLQAAKDDAATPWPVNFAVGTAKSRLDLVKFQQSVRPVHHLTKELVGEGKPDPKPLLLFNRTDPPEETNGDEKPMTEKRRKELLSYGQIGPAVLRDEKAATSRQGGA